jgi:RimJ/RimL family protein N-acetyltransferase
MSTIIEIPTLRTPNLTLRAFRPADLDAFAAMNADPVFRRYLGGGALLSREQTWALMETVLGQWGLRGYGLFAVEAGGAFVGRVGILHPLDWPAPELAWGIAPAAWGRGLATEAARAARDWAFEQAGLPRLVSFILPANRPSVRVAERLGAVPEGQVAVRDFVADLWVHPTPGGGMVA